eukprot:scaffold43800_cov30-Tisochrysis_lutea.AAC.1
MNGALGSCNTAAANFSRPLADWSARERTGALPPPGHRSLSTPPPPFFCHTRVPPEPQSIAISCAAIAGGAAHHRRRRARPANTIIDCSHTVNEK